MLQFREFSAWITIDGQPAPEYAVEVSEDERTVTCWVASKLGSRFSVEWKNASYSHPTRGKVVVDGKTCGARVIFARKLPASTSMSGISDAHCVKPFVFSALELTDDDAFLGGPARLNELGVINLTINAVEITGSTNDPKQLEFSELKVHERSKKAVTQHTTLAEPEFFQKPESFIKSKRIGPHLVRFLFKYRPADIPRANGIMPQLKRKPSAEPVRPQMPDDTLADEEEERSLRETLNPLQETLNSLQKRLTALEAKRLKRETETKPRVKREADDSVVDLAQTRERKKVKLEKGFVSGEVIDLT